VLVRAARTFLEREIVREALRAICIVDCFEVRWGCAPCAGCCGIDSIVKVPILEFSGAQSSNGLRRKAEI
jgi:hypothetical protein